MKKIISVALAILLLMSSLLMTSCGGVKSDISKADKKMQEVDNCKASSTVEIKMKSQGVTITTSMIYDMTYVDLLSETPKLYADVTIKAFNEEVKGVIYREDGWDYTVAEGEKFKSPVDENNDATIFELPDEVLKYAETSVKDGIKTISVDIDPDDFEELFPKFCETAYALYFEKDDIDSMVIKDGFVTVSIDKDGYLRDDNMGMICELTVEGETIEVTVTAAVRYSEYNGNHTVTPPQGYKSFPEADEGISGGITTV